MGPCVRRDDIPVITCTSEWAVDELAVEICQKSVAVVPHKRRAMPEA